ncbi:MAG TPA: FkbM family methyltransferase [Herpetosiphonaceae bacterium]|nr:FkbM family methyltransferase [Herpetosiphonaceae bacterium]
MIKKAIRMALGRDPNIAPDVRVPTERHGSAYGGWEIRPPLNSDSVIYSFGVGEDISFDLALIERYGVTVHAFDPTPRSVAWVRQQRPPAGFRLSACGLADYDGAATFFPPANPEHVSHTMLGRGDSAGEAISVPVRRLATLMAERGHDRIDLLKMDIEGAEYAVLADIAGLPIGQILVEFHHRFKDVGVARTRAAVALLRERGYRLFAVSPSGEEYSFLHSPGEEKQ